MVEGTIGDIVRKMEQEDQDGNTTISKYVSYSQRELIEKIDAYSNSKHITGDKDSSGRDKPFFNIVTAAVNIWYRATDIDRKNIKLIATKSSDVVLAFVVTILLQDFMKKSYFGKFLNEWGRTLAKYCSAVSKFVEKDGELIAEIIPWNRLITDPIDFNNNIKIERLWLTPSQLRANKFYNQDMVEDLLETKKARETMDGQKVDTKSDYIELYEVHGELPLFYITGKESDMKEYRQQMHVISYIARKTKGKDKEYDDFTLYKGKESKDPYRIDHLIKEDGRTIGIGAVEHLFEPQWMINHNIKAIKDQLDLASKLIFQTSDGNFVGQNFLSSIENGDILIHSANQPLTQINNNSHDITSLQNYASQWKAQANEIVGISESMLGVSAKSGTAWRQTQAELQEAHSLFELMTENKGLAIEEMLREHIIPFLKKKMDTVKEVSAILDEYQIKKIDSLFVPNEAIRRSNENTKERILSGELVKPEEQMMEIEKNKQEIQGQLSTMGNQRFISPSDLKDKTWKEVLKDFEWEVEVDITNENRDSNAVLQTLTTVLQTLSSNPMILQDPNMKMLFNKIISETGAISMLELSETQSQPQQPASEMDNLIKQQEMQLA